jgi:hypothetical protein
MRVRPTQCGVALCAITVGTVTVAAPCPRRASRRRSCLALDMSFRRCHRAVASHGAEPAFLQSDPV